jgi:hypothetical protein
MSGNLAHDTRPLGRDRASIARVDKTARAPLARFSIPVRVNRVPLDIIKRKRVTPAWHPND